jgi:hypothetical protein
MLQPTLDLSSLALLIGLKTEFKEGKRIRQGQVTGVFTVHDTGGSENRFVVELSEHGRHHYIAYSDLVPVGQGSAVTVAVA